MQMRRRGLIVTGIGFALVVASFGIVYTIFPSSDSAMSEELFVLRLFEGLFDQVTDESVIYPQTSAVFSYSGHNADVPLIWGVQILDFEEGDSVTVSVSNIYGDDFGSVQSSDPVVFDTLVIAGHDSYSFEVTNDGDRPVTAMMMFIEDPENSETLNDPDSPLLGIAIPLIVSGAVLIIGIIVMVVGTVIFVVDWKKEKNRY